MCDLSSIDISDCLGVTNFTWVANKRILIASARKSTSAWGDLQSADSFWKVDFRFQSENTCDALEEMIVWI